MVTHKVRQTLYLPHTQHNKLLQLSELLGIGISETARQILGPALARALKR